MNNQKRNLLLFVGIFAMGALAYSILIPSFETTEFNQEVIDDISKGITTTSTTNEINNNENLQDIDNEKPEEETIFEFFNVTAKLRIFIPFFESKRIIPG